MENTTAKVSCFARAFHDENNEAPIFCDSVAKKLLGEEYSQIAENMSDGIPFFLPGFKGTREEGLRRIVDGQLSPSVLARSAFCEAMLKNEIEAGCRQYLIFASGYDTFSIRNKESSLNIFELDFPEVLEDKRKKVEKAGLKISAIDVPCNLAESKWVEILKEKGYTEEEKSFGSLLGISYYLTKEAFRAFLNSVGKIYSKGSAICFDYPSIDESQETKINQQLAKEAGEKMQALYEPQEIAMILKSCGFVILEHLDHQAMSEQFFSDYNERNPKRTMHAPKGVNYIIAVKK